MLSGKSIHHSIVTLHSGLAKYYYHKIFYSASFALISIFIPIYIFTLGFSLLEVILWMVIWRWSQPFFTFRAGKLANRIGMKNVILISILSTPVFFFLLWQLSSYPLLFIPTAILWGALNCVYWSQELTLFIEVAKSKRAGIERGFNNMLANIFGLFAPAIGGVILAVLGMPFLIAVSSAILLASILPLLRIKNAHFRLRIPHHDRSKRHHIDRTTLLEMVHRGFHYQGTGVILPLFLFILGLKIIEVGLIGTLFALVGIFVPLIAGKLTDTNRDLVVLFNYIFFAVGWLLILLPGTAFLYAGIFLLALASPSLWLTVCKRVCTIGKRDPSYFGTALEVFDDFGAGIAAIILFILLFFTGMETMIAVFGLTALVFTGWKIRNIKKQI